MVSAMAGHWAVSSVVATVVRMGHPKATHWAGHWAVEMDWLTVASTVVETVAQRADASAAKWAAMMVDRWGF